MTTNQQDSHRRTIAGKRLRPESLMMGYGYRPELSVGAIKPPLFLTSTFVFQSAEEGKAFFELAYGLRKERPGEEMGLIYSRLNNPNLEILEDRLTLWDEAEAAAVFESGMAAISTTLLTFLTPGDVILFSEPVYGGTDYLLKHILPRFGIRPVGVLANAGMAGFEQALLDRHIRDQVGMIYIETPANPTNALVDIAACAGLARRLSRPGRQVLLAVDNTFLGPLWQHPLKHGADLVLYSATKFIGGHSDLIAGVALGAKSLINQIKGFRTILGTMASPMTGWMLLRSLETLKLRMTSQMKNARYVADFLADHPKVERVYYLGHLAPDTPEHALYRRQCLAPGSMISFELVGGEAEAFRFLNALQLFHLAVSLGGTESLAEHPASMTHSDVDPEERIEMGITDKMVRLSIGVEHPEDLIADLEQALAAV
ncbi:MULTISPECIES: cystathionine gamma-synthase family protein [Caldilinea]|jgi:methionine-gamma-lyase|uniref:homocysteine desulfhydrase n=1 Tax=Caldilinea aerophila (strain DSM 14535 / JCM 11387 / NBRC 104270 / STL-6-O1) TaxID=926550 RepID=I0I6F2_CALAS|nr:MULTISPECIES: cystathionine gamma-synthase family protein [Caldilinea]MBO9392964.1 cystathionine gamma-synthase family protein [Caldilinea sp.]BAM00840.1 putative methionine-gamma-lyase [Caldilinea aerophila DSM 14535 = NBRC 104270]GIV72180.1 MAG: methionine gamma-lyase [Caldilinea sp.]